MSPYLWVMWKRLPIILLTMAITLAVAFTLSARSPTLYTAKAAILVTPFGINRPDNASRLYLEQVTNTFSAMLSGETVVAEAKRYLGTETLPAFDLNAVPNSELLELTVRDRNAAFAEEAANALADILVANVSSRYNANLRNIEQTISRQLEKREGEIQTLTRERAQAVGDGDNGRRAELDTLILANQNAYNDLLQRRNQALVAAATQANLASVFEVATTAVRPSSPRTPLIPIAGAVVGLFSGLALAFISEKANPRLYYPSQVKTAVGVDVLGNVPRVGRRELRVHTEGHIVDAFRRLHAALARFGLRDVLLITSPQPKDGSSFIAANLADSLAWGRSKTLLVDANFGSPTVHRVFKLANETGLSDVLAGQVLLTQAIQESGSGLHVLTAGSNRLAAADLLGSENMRQLTLELKEHYDYVVIDSASVLAVADAAILSRFADAVLLVVRRDASEEAVTRAAAELSGVRVGVVLNGYPTPAKPAWTRRYMG